MGKPPIAVYDAFVDQFKRIGKRLPSPRYLVNYFISAHPGSTLKDALEMALYLIRRRIHPEQVQDFIPLPLTLSGAMYHTEKHPDTGKRIYVAKTFRERKMQRALVQYRNPSNRQLIRDALKELKSEHLAPLFFKAAAGRVPGRPIATGGPKEGRTGTKPLPARRSGRTRSGKTGAAVRRRPRR
jgi:radical SAM superfamily enzyme YgiQ (UPF0313 family)